MYSLVGAVYTLERDASSIFQRPTGTWYVIARRQCFGADFKFATRARVSNLQAHVPV